MPKTLFLILCLAALSVGAQTQPALVPTSLDQAAPYLKHQNTETPNLQHTVPVAPGRKSVLATTIVGETNYDLQTNGSVGKRIMYDPTSGELAAVWTGSTSASPYSDRGTFYNFNPGSSWGAKPTARIENLRTGWPTIVHTNSSELIISHDFGTFNLIPSRRTTAGSGTWTQGTSLGDPNINPVWARAAAGGTNGNSVHVIAITAPVASGGVVYKGFDGALLYWRSLDGGSSWDIQDSIIPQIDTADHYGFSADSYAIDARDSIVAIAVFNDFEASFLLKSTDNGNSWTRTEFWTTGLQRYNPDAVGTVSDVNNDALIDTVESTDNSGEVIIDGNGLIHVFFGRQRYLDDDPILDGGFSYFPFTNGLYYWNENSSSASIITGAIDLDSDGSLGITANTQIAQYFQSLSTFPSAGLDANNNIFLTYSALNELEFSGTQFFNKIYAMASRDGGTTWSAPRELTSDLPSVECVFGSLAQSVDNEYHLIFQLDGEPGGIVRGDLDPPGSNDIVYINIDTASNIGLREYELEHGQLNSVYPNPASDQVSLDFTVKVAGKYTLEITDIIGVRLRSVALGNMGSGRKVETLEINNLKAGVYLISLSNGEMRSTQRLVIE